MSMENLKVVSVRTAALLSIFCGQAPVETITDLNISNIALEKNYIFISIEDDWETTSKKHRTGEVKCPW